MNLILKLDQIGDKWTGNVDRKWDARNSSKWFSHNSNLFIIGCCFANNLSRWLVQQGIISSPPNWGMHYNPATILNELRIINKDPEEKNIIWRVKNRDNEEIYVDCLRHTIYGKTLDELHKKRAQIAEVGRNYFNKATAFVITFGLAEVWEQTISTGEKVIINRAPYREFIGREPNLENRFLTTDEAKKYIKDIIKTIRQAKKEVVPIIFAVSPPPLKNSSSGFDPVLANIRSKSILIDALHQVVDEDKTVSYFPAYDIFYGIPSLKNKWQDDYRHPTAEAIAFISQQFVNIYGENPTEFDYKINFSVPKV